MNIEEHKLNLRENGYTIVKEVYSDSYLSEIRDLTNEIIDYSNKNLEDPFSSYYLGHRSDQGVLYDLYQRHPEYQHFAKSSVVLDILEGVIGNDIFLYENTLVYKPKGKSNAVPWHQDFISRPNEPKKYIVWTALDNVTVENGALKAIPRSHINGYLPWYRVKGETHHDRIDISRLNEADSVYLEMQAGDILIFDCMLCHASDEVHVDIPRRAYRVSYQGFDTIYTPRGAPIVLRGGRPATLEKKYPSPCQPVNKNLLTRILNKIGRELVKF